MTPNQSLNCNGDDSKDRIGFGGEWTGDGFEPSPRPSGDCDDVGVDYTKLSHRDRERLIELLKTPAVQAQHNIDIKYDYEVPLEEGILKEDWADVFDTLNVFEKDSCLGLYFLGANGIQSELWLLVDKHLRLGGFRL